jgi:hypothetical protein
MNGQFDQQEIVDDRKRQHGGIQKGDQEESGRTQAARKRDDFLLPLIQNGWQKLSSSEKVSLQGGSTLRSTAVRL